MTAGRSIERAGALLLPADHAGAAEAVDAPSWNLPARWPEERLVWGHGPLPSGTPPLSAVLAAAARERGIWRLRRQRPAHLSYVRTHRLPPAGPDSGGIRDHLRAMLLSGALVELAATGAGERVIDAIARAAGTTQPVGEFRVGSGGEVLLARLPLEHGEAVLRVAASGSRGDPSRAAAALELLAAEGVHVAPRLLGKGEQAGASWTAETLEPGRRPQGLDQALAQLVSRAWTQLPGADGPPTALAADLESIAELVPRCASALRSLTDDARRRCAGVPARMRHGDLWTANLLQVEHGAVVAVDWDAWDAAGVPGADLLQLCATEWRHARRESLGTAWRRRPWADPAYLRLTEAYWKGIGVEPHPALLETVGLAWWAGEVAGTLARLPERRTDSAWLASNVDPVLMECGV